MFPLRRRDILLGSLMLLPPPALAQKTVPPWRRVKELEASSGAEIGVAAVDTGNGAAIFWRESQRFRLCSTLKLPLVACVLARADAGQEDLARVVRYTAGDLLDVSPRTSASLATGMRVDALCEAAIRYSDNTAANLLFASVGGPEALTRWLRSQRDTVTRSDRIEPALNTPDGDKDTATPSAMLGTLKTLLLGDALSPASRARLLGWLAASTTGDAMLRAGLPAGWTAGDKTGRWTAQGSEATNDIAIVTPPGRKPILIAVFVKGGSGTDADRAAIVAQVGRIAGDAFGSSKLAIR